MFTHRNCAIAVFYMNHKWNSVVKIVIKTSPNAEYANF